jgi:hypothetical protein
MNPPALAAASWRCKRIVVMAGLTSFSTPCRDFAQNQRTKERTKKKCHAFLPPLPPPPLLKLLSLPPLALLQSSRNIVSLLLDSVMRRTRSRAPTSALFPDSKHKPFLELNLELEAPSSQLPLPTASPNSKFQTNNR